MATAKTHTLTLIKSSALSLVVALRQPSAFTDPDEVVLGTRINDYVQKQLPEIKLEEDGRSFRILTQELESWRDSRWVLTLSEGARQVTQKAVKLAVAKGYLIPGPGLTVLLVELGLAKAIDDSDVTGNGSDAPVTTAPEVP